MDAIPTHQSLAYLAFFAGRMDEKELVQNARATVVLRYRAAIRRYLGGWFQVADADDLAQEVFTRILDGNCGIWNARKDRFRAFLLRLVQKIGWEFIRMGRNKRALIREVPEVATEQSGGDAVEDPEWLSKYRISILDRAWGRLEVFQSETTDNAYFTALRLKVDSPESSSEELAAKLSESDGRTFTAEGYRQTLHRARTKYGRFVCADVRDSQPHPTRPAIEEELCDLELMDQVTGLLNDHDWEDILDLRE